MERTSDDESIPSDQPENKSARERELEKQNEEYRHQIQQLLAEIERLRKPLYNPWNDWDEAKRRGDEYRHQTVIAQRLADIEVIRCGA